MTTDDRFSVGFLTKRGLRRRIADAMTAGVLLVAAATAAAGDLHSVADIERVAAAHLSGQAGGAKVTAGPLDRRLRLARCDRELEAFLRPGTTVGRRTVVGVRCPGSQPWKVYVPVNLAITAEVVVLARPLPRGHRLAAADLAVERRDVSRAAGGYLTAVDAAVGRRLKQSLRAGSLLGPRQLDAEVLVRRGQAVTLTASYAGIRIRVTGKALMDGTENERIRVRNESSGRIVEGLVRSAELVEVLVH